MHELGVEAYLVWSRRRFGGKFADRQPEGLTADEWGELSSELSKP
jgi:hypothetical protein